MIRRHRLPLWKRALQWLFNPWLNRLLSSTTSRRVVRARFSYPRPRLRHSWATLAGFMVAWCGYAWMVAEILAAYLG
jgi:hypothetical protein